MDKMRNARNRESTSAALAGLLALGILGLPGAVSAKPLVVHEWGTFTTLATSSGELLEGLYVDATRLPAFVHGLPFFNYGAAGWPATSKLKGVTVKMETPVLYFYSEGALDITAKVGFKGGTISQWFPQRASGEANPVGPVVDFGDEPYQGSIAWKAKVLAKGVTKPYTQATTFTPAEAEWTAPRNTAANLLEGQNGEIEKFLFYRGLGNFPQSLSIRFDAKGNLVVKNSGAEAIPFVLLYDRAMEEGMGGAAAIWWKGPLKAGEEKSAPRPAKGDYSVGSQAMDELHKEMVTAGLYADEARALLNTWYNGYFIEGGIKAFWIVPRKEVDRILPLELSPAPDSLERVIIGRSEILPPEFEAKLKTEGGTLPAYAKDKYYLAYLDFLDRKAYPNGVTAKGPITGKRPWRMALPWEGPLASPAFLAPGHGALRDLSGRAALPR